MDGGILHKGQLEAKLGDENQLIRSGVLRDENPLDLSKEFDDFLLACRQGDLATCQRMISKGININAKDQFDYTPLIIASLCGHYQLVELLLESGARALRNTFQGERCIYNALNDGIRNLLLRYAYTKTTHPLQSWAAYIESLMHSHVPKTSDISLVTGTISFELHRFFLFLRSPFFNQKLRESPNIASIKLPQTLPVESVKHVIRYLYLGEPPADLVDPGSASSDSEVLAGVDKISRQLQAQRIWDTILTAHEDPRLSRQKYQDEVNRAQTELESFLDSHLFPAKIVVSQDSVDDVKWKFTNPVFADVMLRADKQNADNTDATASGIESSTIPIGPVQRSKDMGKAVLYPVHRAFLLRSQYFEAMFRSRFSEAQPSEHLVITSLDCSPEALEVIIRYMYTDKFNCPLALAMEVLYTADMLMFDALKTKAAATISNLASASKNVWLDRTSVGVGEGSTETLEAEPINVYDTLRAAWDLGIPKLEEFAGRYLAYRLEDYIEDENFAAMIKESASRVKDRQETDTIELLDDIRYFLSERFRMRFEDAGLDDMLEDEAKAAIEASTNVHINTSAFDENNHTGAPACAEDGTAVSSSPAVQGEMRTLDGQLVDDEFDSDALNYRILLEKIDKLLDRLDLDA